MRIRCRLGVHEWLSWVDRYVHTGVQQHRNPSAPHLKVETSIKTRQCRHCGMRQIRRGSSIYRGN